MMKMAESDSQTNLAILCPKVEAKDILFASQNDVKLPPKSSLFYTKPLVGMIIRPLFDEDKENEANNK